MVQLYNGHNFISAAYIHVSGCYSTIFIACSNTRYNTYEHIIKQNTLLDKCIHQSYLR